MLLLNQHSKVKEKYIPIMQGYAKNYFLTLKQRLLNHLNCNHKHNSIACADMLCLNELYRNVMEM